MREGTPLFTTGRRMLGIAFVLVLSLLVWLSIAAYQKKFTAADMVTLHTGSAGNEMHRNADVKLRGVVVGQVREVRADGGGARLTLAFKPGMLDHVPANVTAQMLPTTLFGQRYVALIPPVQPAGQPLAPGSVITQDRSQNAIELEQVLENVLPLLTAVKPERLAATLTAVADALEGRGDQLGATMVKLDAHLKKLNPYLPQMNRDLRELVRVSHAYADAAPDILDALEDFAITSRTIVDQRGNLSDLYSSMTSSSRYLTEWLRANRDNIIWLSANSRPSLELMARYSPSWPCTLRMLRDFVPSMDRALGKGTGKPGLSVTVKVVPSKGRYRPGKDRPVYNAGGGPRCYSVPYDGVGTVPGNGLTGWGTPPAVTPTTPTAPAPGGRLLGLPNSPEENQQLNELLAAQVGRPHDELPDWSSVLVGPIYRGTEVRLK
ncbi:phospholipid/cholesterol/gamma-HCH transport system substrate-binding protein [Thermomonospora echinospora]|uniref:Phospholipid/cholesterol/gamma-HCH transport system substrate-binding protein n=1 Tax=Thermomonospora echinospora TaxID=1992 RepID=A0A1H5Y1B1_9ACTN|nr:MCE family protein [Thermomonospora echinospora]SEG17761.1 phospholipid/cholesterol/gamma-HCH transport system substrate-binding protein [Thermomonospora echinospora]